MKTPAPTSITSDQALAIATAFLEASKEVGLYRLTHFLELPEAARQQLQDQQWDLSNYASELITRAVGIILRDMQADLAAIAIATHDATRVVRTIGHIKETISAAAALVELGAAIAERNPAAIVKKAAAAISLAQGILGGPAPASPGAA